MLKLQIKYLFITVLFAMPVFANASKAETTIKYFSSVKTDSTSQNSKPVQFVSVKPFVSHKSIGKDDELLKTQPISQKKVSSNSPHHIRKVRVKHIRQQPKSQIAQVVIESPKLQLEKIETKAEVIHTEPQTKIALAQTPQVQLKNINPKNEVTPHDAQAKIALIQTVQLRPQNKEPETQVEQTNIQKTEPKPQASRDSRPPISFVKPRPYQEGRAWNLKDVDLRTLINEVSEITGKNFVVGPNVNAKVTFISQDKLSPDELFKAFETLLGAYGFEAIPRGNIIEITSLSKLKRNESAILLEDATSDHGPIVVTTFRIKNYPVADLVKILKPLLPRFSYLEAYKPSNDLIIADVAANIPNVEELIHRLDRPAKQQVEVIPLRYALADELVKSLNDLLVTSGSRAAATAGHAKLSIVAESRSNSLLVNGGDLEQRRDLMSLIAQLDTKRRKRQEDTEVIYLKYLPAETFAPIVQNLLDNYMAELTGKSLDRSSAAARVTTTSSSTSQAPSMVGSFNLQNPLSNQGTTGGAPSISGFAGRGGTDVSKSGSYGPRVQWEQSTNSIIVTAPQDLIRRVRYVVKQLDIRRPQVLIEAIIAECTLEKDLELGIEWREFNNQFNTRFNPTGPLTSIDSSTGNYNTGGIVGAVGSGLTLGIFKDMNLRFLLRALKGDQNTNILATPNIVTLDNEPALIKIGRQVSFAIGEIQNNPTGGNPFTSYNREDVGLTLSVKPQITPNGSIRLFVEQVLSNVLPGTERVGGNPDTSQRYISTTVMADDGQILVLGGLLQNEWQQVDDKVPVLGDIPYVGALFRNTYRKRTKTNLMLFLRPVIIYDQRESEIISNGKYSYLNQARDSHPNGHKPQAHLFSQTSEKLNLPAPW